MNELLINETTKTELASFLRRPSHALLLAGPDGSGRLTLAKSLAAELLGINASKLDSSAGFRLVESDEKNNISVDAVRELKQFTKLKSAQTSGASASRVIVVSEANKMLAPAQNSFLKLLEEPPAGVIIILTAPIASLKPTIISRVQQISVRPVSLAAASEYFSASSDSLAQIFRISGGRLGLISQLLESSDEHPLKLAVNDARAILTADRYQRLCLVDQLAKDKNRTLAAIAMLGQMASAALEKASDNASLARWQRVLKSSYQAESALTSKANAKLVLTDLMINL